MAKVGTSIRIDEDLLEALDEIAERRYGSNRNAAIEDAVKRFVESIGRCPKCKQINPEDAQYCLVCGTPLTEEAREQRERIKRDIAEHPEVVAEALQEYVNELRSFTSNKLDYKISFYETLESLTGETKERKRDKTKRKEECENNQ